MFESNLTPEYRGRLARWQARRVRAYVETNLDARLKVSEIAGTVHLSSSHFSRAFKAWSGKAPGQYRNRSGRGPAGALAG